MNIIIIIICLLENVEHSHTHTHVYLALLLPRWVYIHGTNLIETWTNVIKSSAPSWPIRRPDFALGLHIYMAIILLLLPCESFLALHSGRVFAISDSAACLGASSLPSSFKYGREREILRWNWIRWWSWSWWRRCWCCYWCQKNDLSFHILGGLYKNNICPQVSWFTCSEGTWIPPLCCSFGCQPSRWLVN